MACHQTRRLQRNRIESIPSGNGLAALIFAGMDNFLNLEWQHAYWQRWRVFASPYNLELGPR